MKDNAMRSPLKVIAVCNRKGGAGKTSTSLNLAVELALIGMRVLLVDLDTQGHCAVGLGIKVKKDQPTVHCIFTDESVRMVHCVHDTPYANLSLAPADQLFEHGSGIKDEKLLQNALQDEELALRYDVVIIDTPPSLDMLLLNALCAAKWVLVPYIPHPLSFEGIRHLMRILFKVMSRSNPGLKILGFLPTAAAEHVRQHRAITGTVSQQFGAHRVLPGIRNDIRLAEAFAAGKPVRYYAPACRGAQDYASLAQSVVPILN